MTTDGSAILNVSFENRNNSNGSVNDDIEQKNVNFSSKISSQWNLDPIDNGRERYNAQTKYEHYQFLVKNQVDSFRWMLGIVILIVIDILLMIVDLSTSNGDPKKVAAFDALSLTFCCIFLCDVGLRIFAYGYKKYFSLKWEIIDFSVVIATFIITIAYVTIDNQSLQQYGSIVVVVRVLRAARILRIFSKKEQFKKQGRKIISQNKRRYNKDGFDLDLTYITDRVIAMSFPSTGTQQLYRNPINEVARFFKTKHPGHFRIYNLCSERGYDETKFDNKIYRVYIDDHNVPTLNDMFKFVNDVKSWMDADDSNVVAIHCKGGKGRTGTMICTWLIECGQFSEAKECLEYFGKRRTDLEVGETFQGVETASQIRYVGYYEQIKKVYYGSLPPPMELQIREIEITSIAGVGDGNGSDLTMEIIMNKTVAASYTFNNKSTCELKYDRGLNKISVELDKSPVLKDDVKIRFTSTNKNLPKGYDQCPFYFWFNTRFVKDGQLVLTRAELDNPHKPKTWHIFKEDFTIWLHFRKIM